MFNTYQELADRINELLKEREKLNNKIKRIEDIYGKIPFYVIENLYRKGVLSEEEQMYWNILQYRKQKEKQNGNE